ncbi:MAG: hypothetical protein ACR2MT_09150 [Aurantibacter sp.]
MKSFHFLLLSVVWFCCCSTDKEETNPNTTEILMQQTISGMAEVTDVVISGDENVYNFSVTIKSPDTGCNQYADWWEVLDLEGKLIYRRILAHSHVNEQPFTRFGGPVEISKNLEVYVRAHMNNTGYGSQVFKGSVANGFAAQDLDIEFAKALEKTPPLPATCDF